MNEFLQICTSMPVVPFTVLGMLCMLYWVIVIFGALDIDGLDLDLDFDVDADIPDVETSVVDWGLVSLKWFNLGDVPLMAWASAFTISAWGLAMFVDRDLAIEGGTNGAYALAILRTIAVGVFAAKFLTQPIKGQFKHKEPNPAEEMIGRNVLITSSEVTADFGQAEFSNGEGAPLKLHVRTEGDALKKGTTARIVGHSPDKRMFYVSGLSDAEVDSHLEG
ncbi:MAG: hypothetical protein R3C18_05220 [Planctomycetaceae bacterium]